MPKKPQPLELMDNAGTLMMQALCANLTNDLAKTAEPHLRRAIYELTVARLWITCPEAMKDASIIGYRSSAPEQVIPPPSSPSPNGTKPPLAPHR